MLCPTWAYGIIVQYFQEERNTLACINIPSIERLGGNSHAASVDLYYIPKRYVLTFQPLDFGLSSVSTFIIYLFH